MRACVVYRSVFSSFKHAVLSTPTRILAASSTPAAHVNAMKKIQLGDSDLQVSVACLGTMVRALQHSAGSCCRSALHAPVVTRLKYHCLFIISHIRLCVPLA